MKARLEKGKIKQYDYMPQSFLTIAEYLPTIEGHNLDENGNSLAYVEGQIVKDALLMTPDVLKKFGFFDIQEEQFFDYRVEELGNLYFDKTEELFKKEILDKDFILSLQECKEVRINDYNSILHREFTKTDYHYIKQLELGTSIPQDVLKSRAALRLEAESVKAEINALTTKKDVLSYNLPNYNF